MAPSHHIDCGDEGHARERWSASHERQRARREADERRERSVEAIARALREARWGPFATGEDEAVLQFESGSVATTLACGTDRHVADYLRVMDTSYTGVRHRLDHYFPLVDALRVATGDAPD